MPTRLPCETASAESGSPACTEIGAQGKVAHVTAVARWVPCVSREAPARDMPRATSKAGPSVRAHADHEERMAAS
eukprot:scaffold2261_cov405-Prasinococcus_capsulatus_cf.AAC.13